MNGRCVVSELELIAEPAYVPGGDNAKQALLQILQRKGAPVNGCLICELDPDYIWTSERNPINNKMLFTWERLPDEYLIDLKTPKKGYITPKKN